MTHDALSALTALTAANIRQARKDRGLTQKDLSDATGIPQPHISRYENGGPSPTLRRLEALADALLTTPSLLLTPQGQQ